MSMIGSQVRAHFSNFISPGDLVFDVGANIGDLTQVFLDLGADVICIDPQPYCIQVLQKRFDGNNHVTIVEKGVSNEPGNLPFFISSRSHSISTFSEAHKNRKRFKSRVWDKTLNVPVTTLDVLIERYGQPSFCKIDVESFEWQVIQGLNSKIPGLSFEFTREFLDDAKKCAQHLARFGRVRFNYALYASYRLDYDRWLALDPFFDALESSRIPYLFGDVYARFTD
jgi:FkbM family methyltransferase